MYVCVDIVIMFYLSIYFYSSTQNAQNHNVVIKKLTHYQMIKHAY